MSAAPNAELVRRAFEAFTRQPKPDWATVNELFHSDHELHSLVGELEGGHARGAAGGRDFQSKLDTTWSQWTLEIQEIHEAPDGRIVMLQRTRYRGKTSEVPLEQRPGAVCALRDGKIIRTDIYATWDDALDAVGLRR